MPFTPQGRYPRSIHPHYLSVYASTQDFDVVAALIPTLQHSIQGLWLGATLAGFPPACHQTISSPHVHGFVTRRCESRLKSR